MRWVLGILLVAAAAGVVWLVLGADAGARAGRTTAQQEAEAERRAGKPDGEDGAEEKVDGPSVRGVVVDEAGDAVSGAEVTWDRLTAKSDREGRFVLRTPRYPSMFLIVRHEDYGAEHHVVQPYDDEPFRIVLHAGAPLRVRVQLPDGGPAAGADVQTGVYVETGEYWFAHTNTAMKADADGVADCGRLRPGWVELFVQLEGYASQSLAFGIKDLEPVEKVVTLGEGGAIEGTVKAPDGRPVKDARVYYRHGDDVLATTDEFGRYRIDGVAGWGVRLAAEADGYGPGAFGEALGWGKAIEITVPAGEVVRGIDIVLGPRTMIRGRVVDEAKQPVPDVQVTLQVENAFARAQHFSTDAQGRFSAGPISAREGARVDVLMSHAEYFVPSTAKKPLEPGRDVDLGTIEASRSAPAKGLVLGLDGRPARDAFVKSGNNTVVVASNGTFQVPLDPGRTVTAYGIGSRRLRSESVRVDYGKEQTIELRLRETRAIGGRVVTTAGAPREDIHLAAIPVGAKQPYRLDVSDHTDKDGRFELPGLLPGEYRVGVVENVHGGWDLAEEPEPATVAAGAGDVTLIVPIKGAILTGKVVSKRTRLPVRKGSIWLYEVLLVIPKYRRGMAFQDERGEFRFETPGPGTWYVEVGAADHADFRTKPVRVKKGDVVDLGTIALGEPGAVYGTVRDHADQPVPWCRIYLVSPKLESNANAPYTDPKGRFEVRGLSPGTYTLFALSPRHPLALKYKIEVEEGGRKKVDVKFSATAPVRIRVVDPQGQPVQGAKLIWTFPAIRPLDSSMVGNREPPGFGSNVSDADGSIVKPFFPEGDVDLKIKKKGFKTARRTVKLTAGEPKEVEIRLERS